MYDYILYTQLANDPKSPEATAIRELCKMRDEFLYDVFSIQQLDLMINEICVNWL